MANIKSAKKRILVTRTKAARNKSIKSAVKTSIRKVDAGSRTEGQSSSRGSTYRGYCYYQQSNIQRCLPQEQLR